MHGRVLGPAFEACSSFFRVGPGLLTGPLLAVVVVEQPPCVKAPHAVSILLWLPSPLESILHFCLLSFLNASSRSSFTSCFELWGHMWFRHNAQM